MLWKCNSGSQLGGLQLTIVRALIDLQNFFHLENCEGSLAFPMKHYKTIISLVKSLCKKAKHCDSFTHKFKKSFRTYL